MFISYYKKYHDRLVNVLRRYDPAEAEDMAQEAWIKIMPKVDAFSGDLWPYLWRVGRSIAIDRKRRPKTPLNGLKIDSVKPAYPDILHELNFDLLNDTQRDVVMLRLKGYDYQRITRITGISYGTLTSAYTHAVLKLRIDLVRRGLIDGEDLILTQKARTISAYKKRQKK